MDSGLDDVVSDSGHTVWVPADRVVRDASEQKRRAFLRSSEQVRGRYLRCRGAWGSHLERSRAAVTESMRRCAGRSLAVVLGGGMLHDIPLQSLASHFERVVIVDVVHLWRSVLAAQRFPKVEQWCVDVSGFVGGKGCDEWSVRFPSELEALCGADLTVSVNLLSQLAVVPRLEMGNQTSRGEMDDLSREMIRMHLRLLERLGGHIVLITDRERWVRCLESGRTVRSDILFGEQIGPFEDEWIWNIAPPPEDSETQDVSHLVGVRRWMAPLRPQAASIF